MSLVDVGTLVAFVLLLVHALKTHGAWFAAIWLGLPAGGHAAVNAWESRSGWSGFAPFAYRDLPTLAITVYLAALLGKGFVERTRFAGRVWPFALAACLCSIPIVLAVAPSLNWGANPKAIESPSFVAWIYGLLIGFFVLLFAAAYRGVSLATSDDSTKFGALFVLVVPIVYASAFAAFAVGALTR